MKFDYGGNIPIFQQVANQLENEIFIGNYTAGEQVPSTTEISNSYQINPATVLKGMNILVEEKILEKRRGLGTFVTTEAMHLIREKRQAKFMDTSIINFIKQAKALGISKVDLQQLIERGYEE